MQLRRLCLKGRNEVLRVRGLAPTAAAAAARAPPRPASVLVAVFFVVTPPPLLRAAVLVLRAVAVAARVVGGAALRVAALVVRALVVLVLLLLPTRQCPEGGCREKRARGTLCKQSGGAGAHAIGLVLSLHARQATRQQARQASRGVDPRAAPVLHGQAPRRHVHVSPQRGGVEAARGNGGVQVLQGKQPLGRLPQLVDCVVDEHSPAGGALLSAPEAGHGKVYSGEAPHVRHDKHSAGLDTVCHRDQANPVEASVVCPRHHLGFRVLGLPDLRLLCTLGRARQQGGEMHQASEEGLEHGHELRPLQQRRGRAQGHQQGA